MDEFVQGLELLINADAGKLFIIFVGVVVIGMGVLSYMLLKGQSKALETRQAEAEREDRRIEFQTGVQSEMNKTMLQFTSAVERSIDKQTALLERFGVVLPALEGLAKNIQVSHEQRATEHVEQNGKLNEIVRLVSVILDELRSLPDSMLAELGNTRDYEPILRRIELLETNLKDALTAAILQSYGQEREG